MNSNKIENVIYRCYTNNHTEMIKPTYSFNSELNCGIIQYNNKTYYVDIEERDNIINFKKKFIFYNESDIYPSYLYNTSRVNYLQFIFGFKDVNVDYIFKNNNQLDLRKSNVVCSHHYNEIISSKYDVIEYVHGHYSKNGVDPYFMKNPMWKIKENDRIYILMYCEKNTICKLCEESYKIILNFEITQNEGKKITWHKHSNGYILSSMNSLFMHQIVMNCYGNGKGTKTISVDHIDRNPLNNTLTNLRIASRSEQEQNSKGISEGTKRERKSSARELPDGLTQQMMMKYLVYYKECYNKEKKLYREFFKVEKHPKLDKHWMSSKSNKISLLEKLASTNKVVADLEKDVYPLDNSDTALPTYITLKQERNKPHLVFDKKSVGTEEKRLNLRMVLPDNYILEEQLTLFREKIKEKYDLEI
jgi:hypothetical protein